MFNRVGLYIFLIYIGRLNEDCGFIYGLQYLDRNMVSTRYDKKSCGWCVTVSNDNAVLSDVFALNNMHGPCDIAETTFSGARSTHVSIARGLNYSVIFNVNLFFFMF
ncbi:b149.2 [miniopterid betaherpesvirus 1]|uniref:B149.2 n=1 Tax=miniopterid betaherpesvirus 1 TaxID=3070189 RepID=I3VQD7_9BETA|nr:b149.2 [miniopterid betaherpesvirus 1]AFK83981.1 b149.2 [miniopterid betaherpesvirus 1]